MVNPYYTNIPTASQYRARTPELSGIDESTIYGKNSPGYGADQSQGAGGSFPWETAIAGAADLAGNAYGMSQQRFHFSNIAPQQQDDNSAPVYTAGQLYNEASGAHPKGAQTGEILGAAGKGAASGAAIGSVVPGIGTAIGAVGGAVVGAASSIFGGGARKKAEEEQKKQALYQASLAQGQYNTADVSYRNHQNQLYDYYNQNNAAGREYNVYKSRF